MIALDGRGFGDVPDDVADACGRLAALARTRWIRYEHVHVGAANLAIAVAKLGLEHVVITSVDRDDLNDGIERQLKGKKPLAQLRHRRAGGRPR